MDKKKIVFNVKMQTSYGTQNVVINIIPLAFHNIIRKIAQSFYSFAKKNVFELAFLQPFFTHTDCALYVELNDRN